MNGVRSTRGVAALALVVLLTGCSTATLAPTSAAPPTRTSPATVAPSQPVAATPTPVPPAAVPNRTVSPVVIKLPAPDGWGKLAASSDAIWMGFTDGLWRIDPKTNKVTATVKLGLSPDFLAFGFNSLWVTSFDGNIVIRVDARSGDVLARILSVAAQGVATSAEGVWVANHHSGAVSFIDPRTNERGTGVSVGPAGDNGPQGMAAIGDKVWVGISNASDVVGIDPSSHAVATTITRLVQPCGDMAASGSTLWVSECEEEGSVDEVDLASGTFIRSASTGGYVGTPIPVADGAWLPISGPPRLLKMSDSTGEPVDAVGLPPDCAFTGLSATTTAFGSIWVSCRLSLLRFAPADLP